MNNDIEIDYAFIKKWLKFGQIAELAKQHKISKDAAYKILSGKVKNYDFLKLCYDEAIERAQIFRSIHDKIHELKNVPNHV